MTISEYPEPTVTIECSDGMKNIWGALFRFQGNTQGVVRDSVNPGYKNSKYASLEAVIETARPGLQAVGIVFLQAPGRYVDGCFHLATMLVHPDSGEWIRFTTSAPLAKVDPQGVGSATTYFCRYALMACLGLPPLDDDGEATRRPVSPLREDARASVSMPSKTMTDSLVISTEQFLELDNLIRKSGADRERFFLAMNVSCLDDLPVSQFQRAKTMLNKKLETKLETKRRGDIVNSVLNKKTDGGDDAR